MLNVKHGNETKEIAQVQFGNRIIAAIYKGARLVWEGIRSCFGAGYWVGTKPWNGQDGWKSFKNK